MDHLGGASSSQRHCPGEEREHNSGEVELLHSKVAQESELVLVARVVGFHMPGEPDSIQLVDHAKAPRPLGRR